MCLTTSDSERVDLFGALNHEYFIRDVGEEGWFDIPLKSSRLLVVLPAGSEVKLKNGKYSSNGLIVAYSDPITHKP